MQPKKFALYGGIVMLAMGLLALIMPGPVEFLPYLTVDASYGLFLGIFPMNIMNKLALIGFGIAGIAVSRRLSADPSVQYSRVVFAVMGLLAILGLIPQTNTLNGIWPLFGAEIWAHAIFAVLGAYFGFATSARMSMSKRTAPGH